nr:PREDICTED: arf-GAP with Rho-GAP domain, ANK repeat and PH domain-containing protein 2 isoform X2 [Latimeria chalumnae]|eukprot:XP_006003528.1 PREDICTED: arf-GAP with Rho-GAP domain, ANK repeat and PH domain-containing protein 2 isoform X2 [Latimeria chalumnae]
MSSSSGASGDIAYLLANIHLEQYTKCFQEAGYRTVEDAAKVTQEALFQMGITRTGHRKRILKQIQFASSKIKSVEAPECNEGGASTQNVLLTDSGCRKQKPVPKLRSYYFKEGIPVKKADGQSEKEEPSSLWNLQADSSHQCLDRSKDNGMEGNTFEKPSHIDQPREVKKQNLASEKKLTLPLKSKSPLPAFYSDHSSSSASSSCSEKMSEKVNVESEEDEVPLLSPLFEFKGEMVVNDLYDGLKDSSVKTQNKSVNLAPTRSYKLRHRPVPELPYHSALLEENCLQWKKRNLGISNTTYVNSVLKNPAVVEQKLSFEDQTPITPYEETFFFNSPEETSGRGFPATTERPSGRQSNEKESQSSRPGKKLNTQGSSDQDDSVAQPLDQLSLESEYSTVEDYIRSSQQSEPNDESKHYSLPYQIKQEPNLHSSVLNEEYLMPFDILHKSVHKDAVIKGESAISPYACFYGSSAKKTKVGWLDKLSPQGKCVFQKRWVKFDSYGLSYYNNDKEMYSKGMVPLSAISTVRRLGDYKFEVVTSHRTFVFRVEKEGDRNDWMNTLLFALKCQSRCTQVRTVEKYGYLELRGHKSKLYTVLSSTKLWLSKTEQDFKAGLAVTVIELNVATIKDTDRKCFEITTPFKIFSFTTESEREKQEWIEVVQESIAETLSDYEVAEKIWFNESNRSCADCRAPDPEWASINLCVVICKKCAGLHRSLGSRISKVRSLKLDTNIWSNELVELFITVGNKNANSFWTANLQPGEELDMDASPEQRRMFITQKYKEGKFRKNLSAIMSQGQLNQALCAAVIKPDVLETLCLVFSGADVMCATGDSIHCTPYLLAQKAAQRLQMEFLHHNKTSDLPKLDSYCETGFHRDGSHSTFMCGFLYKAAATSKPFTEKKLKEDLSKRWCTLEGGFLSYYESDKTAMPNGRIDISEVVCLAVNKPDSPVFSGAIFTFELYLLSEYVFLFGAESVESQRDWTQAIAKCFVPPDAESLAKRNYDLIGQLYYKDCRNLDHWKLGWFSLDKSCLCFCCQQDDVQEDIVNLKRLQELTVKTQSENNEKTDVLLLVEKGRTLYIHGHAKLDFIVWHSAIEKAAGTDGNALRDQQLSKNDVPIIVDSCIAFVTQYGLGTEGIYQKNGNSSRVNNLLELFRKDARNVKLRAGEHELEDVTSVLKRFLYETDDALLNKELYPYWISALDMQDENGRVEKYTTYIRTLPRVNRTTLSALIGHLYRVQKCSEMNHMDTRSLATVFSSCFFQTEGQTDQEVSVIEDLINNYVQLFDVNEQQVKQMEKENVFITQWKNTQVSQAGDLLIEVYLEKKEIDRCNIIRVSPNMRVEELTKHILEIKNIIPHRRDMWTTFEAIENGELERPLQSEEKVLEQVLQWSSLEEPGSAYLVVKRFQAANKIRSYLAKNTNEFVKAGYMKYKEEPSKLLSGNKFQERYVVLREEKLLLYKDMKSTKPEKELHVKSSKIYQGLKRKVRPPTNWGFTIYTEKQQWQLCCDGQEVQTEWLASIYIVQYDGDLWPSATKGRLSYTPKYSKAGSMPLIPIHQEKSKGKSPQKLHQGKSKTKSPPKVEDTQICHRNSKQTESSIQDACKGHCTSTVKQRASLLAYCLEHKEGSANTLSHKHRSIANLETKPLQKSKQELKDTNQTWGKRSKTGMVSDARLPPNVLKELSTVLHKSNRSFKED